MTVVPRFTADGSTLKPNLLAVKSEGTLLIDVHIVTDFINLKERILQGNKNTIRRV